MIAAVMAFSVRVRDEGNIVGVNYSAEEKYSPTARLLPDWK